MASGRARSRARERIEEIARLPLDSEAFRIEVRDIIAEVLDFDGYVWLLTDPATAVGASPLADVPGVSLTELPALIRAKYLSGSNRWTGLMLSAEPVGRLGDLLDAEDGRASKWRAFLRALGVRDIASTVFADPFGCWGFLDLWRMAHQAPFTDEEADFLSGLAPAVTTALRDCQARTFVEPALPRREDVGPVVLTLDDDLRILGRTAASQGWLDVLLPAAQGGQAVPASVYNVAAQLLAVEAGVDDHAASTRAHLGDGFWLALRAARMPRVGRNGDEADDSPARIVVSIEETSTVERIDLFARACGLTPREGELLGLLAAGADTRAMARAMGLSLHTVQDHLKAIFAKSGSHDRVGLLSRVMGTRNGVVLPR